MSDKITISTEPPFCSEDIMDEGRVYVKQENRNNEQVWAIYSPEGECMAQTFSHEMAMAIIRQNDLTAAQVH